MPGVLAALTNVLLLIYTSTQYSGWTATEKAKEHWGAADVHVPLSKTNTLCDKLPCFQIVFFVFLEHVIFGSKRQPQVWIYSVST